MIRNDASDRQLRDSRGARRTITDDVPELNECLSSKRAFTVETKITSGRFPERFVRYMTGKDFTLDYVRRNGFFSPLVFRNKEGLDMRMPNEQFSVDDVKCYVGNRRIIDVMDVSSQQALEMAMEEFAAYYQSRKRSRLLNVTSLEFSQTPMDQLVQSPRVVRLIDWVDKVWPHNLKLEQTEGTNQMMNMKYPKVQKYCLISVGGSYTDFHINFGGTSVWYHVLRGEKIFWLIPPTPENLIIYEEWVKSGRQQDVFLGDLVNECGLVRLREGYTFMIPTGWIHAVYTPMDSLAFGGNFLHSFNIEGQLVVSDIEDRTQVPFKSRYPFFVEIMWYVIKDYVTSLERKRDNSAAALLNCLSLYEIQGLAALVFRMEQTPLWRKRVPTEMSDPEALLIRLKSLLNGYQILTTYMASELREEKPRSVRDDSPPPPSLSPSQRFSDHYYWRFPEAKRTKTEDDRHQNDDDDDGELTAARVRRRDDVVAASHSLQDVRERRNRCGRCVRCLSVECRECRHCLDMPKNGGTGRLRQACEKRKCLKMKCQTTEETEDRDDSENDDDDEEEVSYDDNDTSSDELSDVSISSSSSHSMPAIGRREKAKVQKTGRTPRSAKSPSAGPDALSELDMFDFNEEALDLMVGSVQGLADLTPDDLVSLYGGTTTDPNGTHSVARTE
ncbi:lysine-specific demethylase 2A-like [Oscarella lobularis]|uniref:lysine-specific demethylase 2A-like n=1 Tax=Oscarella lobularis TaxID=121494 RepID=UPI0033142A60